MGKLNEKKAKEAVKVRHVEEAEAMVKSTEVRQPFPFSFSLPPLCSVAPSKLLV